MNGAEAILHYCWVAARFVLFSLYGKQRLPGKNYTYARLVPSSPLIRLPLELEHSLRLAR